MKKNPIIVTNINKLGGVKSDLPDAFGAHIERPFACMSVQKVALLVSALWLMVSAPLVLTSCTDDERVATPDAVETRSNTPSDTSTSDSIYTSDTSHTPDADTDTGQSFYGEISDWREETGEVTSTKKGGF